MKYELINYCEIDKWASIAYSAIHGEPADKNLGDVTTINPQLLPKNYTILTHGSPCTSFSNAGLQLGGDKNSGTPSSLMWSSVDIIKHSHPKIVIWENVPNVLNDKHIHNFNQYIEQLETLGYNSYFKMLNALDFNIPQNRKRIFVISICAEMDKGYVFPDKQKRQMQLQDILETHVDEKFYLNNKQVEAIRNSNYGITSRRIQVKNYCATICARDYKGPKCVIADNKVRKMTPKEYWRLQGFSDEDYCKVKEAGLSNSQLYQQAGNSICCDVVQAIFQTLFTQYPELIKDLKILSLFSGIGAFEKALKNL